MNYRIITRIIGRILCVVAVFMIPALLISLFRGEGAAALALGITIAASAVIGVLLALVRPSRPGFFAFRWRRFGLSAMRLLPVSTAGLNSNSE